MSYICVNFISIYIGDNYSKMLDIFEQNNIYVRNRSNIQNMHGFIRITIGNEHNINIEKLKGAKINSAEVFSSSRILTYYSIKGMKGRKFRLHFSLKLDLISFILSMAILLFRALKPVHKLF